MLASSAEKATWCVRSFCLVKSSYKTILQATNAGRGGLGRRLVGFIIVTGSEAIEMSSNWFIMLCIFYCTSSCRHQSARVTVMGSTTVPTAVFALTTLSQTIRWITKVIVLASWFDGIINTLTCVCTSVCLSVCYRSVCWGEGGVVRDPD